MSPAVIFHAASITVRDWAVREHPPPRAGRELRPGPGLDSTAAVPGHRSRLVYMQMPPAQYADGRDKSLIRAVCAPKEHTRPYRRLIYKHSDKSAA